MKMPLIPVVPENHSHVLAEFDCLDPLLSALRLDSGRLKVGFTITCLSFMVKSHIININGSYTTTFEYLPILNGI